MKDKTKFTKKEIIVVLGCAVFLVINLGAFNEKGRGHAKKMVCLTNVRRLAHAWLLYARDNDGKIVNGAIGYSNMQMSWGDHRNEPAWIDAFSNSDWNVQMQGIKDGALWPYVKDIKVYRCPVGRRGEALTYAIMFSMNAINHTWTQGVPGAHVKNLSEITNPAPAYRLVFIDEGYMTTDAYAVYYNQEVWFDSPPVRHGDGTTLSFADGHADHWKWKGTDTIQHARVEEYTGPHVGWAPTTQAGYQDLYRMQRGCWGKLGYSPTH